jgi:hypothetical protein
MKMETTPTPATWAVAYTDLVEVCEAILRDGKIFRSDCNCDNCVKIRYKMQTALRTMGHLS